MSPPAPLSLLLGSLSPQSFSMASSGLLPSPACAEDPRPSGSPQEGRVPWIMWVERGALVLLFPSAEAMNPLSLESCTHHPHSSARATSSPALTILCTCPCRYQPPAPAPHTPASSSQFFLCDCLFPFPQIITQTHLENKNNTQRTTCQKILVKMKKPHKTKTRPVQIPQICSLDLFLIFPVLYQANFKVPPQ